MRKYRYAALSLAAAVMAFVVMAPASALGTAVLTLDSPGGPDVPLGDAILASGSTSFTSSPGGSTGVFCSVSTFTVMMTLNPPAGGTATGTLTGVSFSSCTETMTGATGVSSIAIDNLPYTVSVNGTTKIVTVGPGNSGPVRTTIKLNTVFGLITCVYAAHDGSLTGVFDNSDHSVTFTDQQFDKVTGPSTCFATGYFNAYLVVTDGGHAVYVN
jgi:hypothetical protein